MKVKTADLVIDEAIQIRDGLDLEMVDRYVECFDALPPIDVFKVASGFLLADGFHRRAAAMKLKKAEMEATLHEGNWEDAEAFAITANTKHGKPLTRVERDRAVRRLLALGWGYDKIQKTAGIPAGTVHDIARLDRVVDHLGVGIPTPTRSHVYQIAKADEQYWGPLAERAVESNWSVNETRAASQTVNNPDVPAAVKAAILDGSLPPITSAGGQVVILEDTVQRVTEEALRHNAELAVVAFNGAAAQLRTFTADQVAEGLDAKLWPATVAQFAVTMTVLDALIARLTMKVVV